MKRRILDRGVSLTHIRIIAPLGLTIFTVVQKRYVSKSLPYFFYHQGFITRLNKKLI